MKRETALALLVTQPCSPGEAVTRAAQALGCTRSAVYQWPDQLPRGVADKVLAAYARKRLKRHAERVARLGRPMPPEALDAIEP